MPKRTIKGKRPQLDSAQLDALCRVERGEKPDDVLRYLFVDLLDEFLNRDLKVAGLLLLQLAINQGVPVPAPVAQWFSEAFGQLSRGKTRSLDQALGLSGGGAAWRRWEARWAERVQLSKMLGHQVRGLTIPDAADLVAADTAQGRGARAGRRSALKLERAYMRARYAATARDMRKLMPKRRKVPSKP